MGPGVLGGAVITAHGGREARWRGSRRNRAYEPVSTVTTRQRWALAVDLFCAPVEVKPPVLNNSMRIGHNIPRAAPPPAEESSGDKEDAKEEGKEGEEEEEEEEGKDGEEEEEEEEEEEDDGDVVDDDEEEKEGAAPKTRKEKVKVRACAHFQGAI